MDGERMSAGASARGQGGPQRSPGRPPVAPYHPGPKTQCRRERATIADSVP